MFGLGAYANETWKTFDGDVAKSESHVEEIMSILRQVNDDKLTAEEALAELEALNPAGLAKINKELREKVKAQEEYLAHLEAELDKANNAVNEMNSSTEDAVNEARGYLISGSDYDK